MKTALIIGGGIGGLSCAIRLAGAGVQVTLLEQQSTVGGKLQRVQLGGYTFDRGPSTITMIESFARVFESVGRHIEDYVHFYPLTPLARNWFADGHCVNLTTDVDEMRAQIAAYSPQDAARYPAFMKEAGKLYAIAQKSFLNQMLLGWRDKLKPSLLASMMKIRPLTTLQQLLRSYFRHPNTLAMFGRYATYVGSSPYRSPAIFAMLASLEAEAGIYGVYGGTYEIVASMEKLAIELGVQIHTSTKVGKINVRNGKAVSVDTITPNVQTYAADIIIANGDALSVYSQLIEARHRPTMDDTTINRYEPSLSGFVILAGARNTFNKLAHHTVFFPPHYETEFEELFTTGTPLTKPTIYVCHNGHDEPEMAPDGCSNLFILVNAPSLKKTASSVINRSSVSRTSATQTGASGPGDHFSDWAHIQEEYGAGVLAMLEQYGLTDLTASIEVRDHFTPLDLQRQTGAHHGAIYGISSNSPRQTFFRPGNRAKDIANLWFVGGTTHPGGGTPIVALSGQLVAERLLAEQV